MTTHNIATEAVQIYEDVKENVLYGLPLRWGTHEHTWLTKRGHCGAKAELLAYRLRERGYTVRYVIGYRVGVLPKVLQPAFLDCHFWSEVLIDDDWLTLDPAPDHIMERLCGGTEPGTHLYNPEYIRRVDDIPPWYKDVYNSWLILPYKIFVSIGLGVIRMYLNIKGAR